MVNGDGLGNSGYRSGRRPSPGEPSRGFQFIEHVLRVGPPVVAPRYWCGLGLVQFQIDHIHAHFIFGRVPEQILRTRIHWLEWVHEDDRRSRLQPCSFTVASAICWQPIVLAPSNSGQGTRDERRWNWCAPRGNTRRAV